VANHEIVFNDAQISDSRSLSKRN